MVILRGGKFQARANVVWFQEGVVGQDFLPGSAVRQQLQYVLHPQPVAANAGPAATLASFGGNAGEQGVHVRDHSHETAKGKAAFKAPAREVRFHTALKPAPKQGNG